MKLIRHVNTVCQKAHNQLRNIGKIQKYLSQDTKEIIVHAFVSTRLDYLNSLLYGMPDYIIKRLQRLLNAAARIITNLGKYDHITDAMKQLHWLPIESRIQYKVLVLVQCICPHPVRKQITVRALRRIKDDALAEDLDRFYVDQGCVDVDIIIEQYDKYFSDLLDKHAPKNIYMW